MTYRKIAELAGVSPSTVSKVFSGSTEISRETADRIRQIAKEHGYTPARYYRGGMQNLHKLRISILVPEIISIYYGADTTEEAANEIAAYMEETYPDCDIEVQPGGQPIYYYVISVE